ARAAFPDDAEGLAPCEPETRAIDGRFRARREEAGAVADDKRVDVEHRGGCHAASSGRWHSQRWAARARSGGVSAAQTGMALGRRGAEAQPGIGTRGGGMEPSMAARRAPCGPASGRAASRARV